jgi:hypothetical protein
LPVTSQKSRSTAILIAATRFCTPKWLTSELPVTRSERNEILQWRNEQARTGISANRLWHWPSVCGGSSGRVRPLVPSHVHHGVLLESGFNPARLAIRTDSRRDRTLTTRTPLSGIVREE